MRMARTVRRIKASSSAAKSVTMARARDSAPMNEIAK